MNYYPEFYRFIFHEGSPCKSKDLYKCLELYEKCMKNNGSPKKCVDDFVQCTACDPVSIFYDSIKDQADIMLVDDFSIVKQDYLILLISLIVAVLLAIFILAASYFLSRQNPDSEKLSPYECGFEPYDDTRHTFDVKFCLVAVLFIVFDIEIMFLIPWCVSISKLSLLGYWSMIDFIIELAIGFFYIWYVNALDWE